MAKWLDKYEQGGLILKKKTKDNYGTKPNVNDAKVSAGPNFVGDGYTAYNWKSPAWGGQFQMGGSLPGSVGFMYARTQNPAPSNGKYTKKTQASAQNGQEMKYWQDGLDFKPKSISQNGNLFKKYDSILNDNIPSTVSVKKNMIEEAEYNKQKAIQKAIDKQGSIKEAGPKRSALSKSWAVATHPMTALEYSVKGRGIPENFDRGPKNVLDYATDVINPYQIADAAASIPGNIGRGEFGQAALNALSIAPVLSEAKGLGKAVNQLSKSKNLKEAAGYLLEGIPVERSLPRLPEGELKTFRQIQEIPKMAQAGKSRAEQMKYALENNIPDKHFERIFETDKKTAQGLIEGGFGERPAVSNEIRERNTRGLRDSFREMLNRPRRTVRQDISELDVNQLRSENEELDQLIQSMYNHPEQYDFNDYVSNEAIPQEYRNQISNISSEQTRRPRRGRMSDLVIEQMNLHHENMLHEDMLDNPEYYDLGTDFDTSSPMLSDLATQYYNSIADLNQEGVINRGGKNFSSIGNRITNAEIKARTKMENMVGNMIQSYPYYSGNVEQRVPSLFRSSEKSLRNVAQKVNTQAKAGDIPSGTVFTGSLNTSHNSWLPQVKQVFSYEGGTPQFTGYKPMNSLGYLSQANVPEEDIVKYLNSEMDALVQRGKLPSNVQRPVMLKGHPMLPQYAIKQHREGGIVDPRGQWAHPGEITTIPSNNITMKNVDYDVLGVSNTGDKKLMKPGKNYKFDGDFVTEYPKGGWLDKYK